MGRCDTNDHQQQLLTEGLGAAFPATKDAVATDDNSNETDQTLNSFLDEWTTIDELCSVTDQLSELTDEEIISGTLCDVPADADRDAEQDAETPPAIT